jgi:GTP-binding protein
MNPDTVPAAAPLVAIVGRPNVGKSTLFNRITGSRKAIVGDEPGITRDRNYGFGEWRGRNFRLVDTGGLQPGEEQEETIPSHIFQQARMALDEAAQVVFVTDGRAEITGTDRELATMLQRLGKPLVLAVNKADSPEVATTMHDWHSLGIGRVLFMSAESGHNIDDLLDEVTADFPVGEAGAQVEPEIRVAIIGKPNVGKSTLLNALAGEERSIVTPIPGTTRDAVDLLAERDGVRFRFVDTAGIRRRGKTKLMAEKLSVVMAQRHIRLCDVAVLMLDALEGVTALDTHIAGYAHEEGKGLIVALNKWDAINDRIHRKGQLEQQVRDEFKFLDYAPVVFLSAKERTNVTKLVKTIAEVGKACARRIPTAELNKFFETLDFGRASQPFGKKAKVLYLTQAHAHPPTFVVFTNRKGKLHFGFERFLMNQIRRQFGFEGTPIVLKTRPRGGS